MTKGTHATWATALRGLRVRLNHAHGWLYARSSGRLGGSVGGHPVLLLITVGRRSGRKRRTPVQYERVGNEIVVVAAGGGSPTPPAWWFNIEADPDVEVRTRAHVWHARAETADPGRRAELWPAVIAANRSIESAQEKAGRQLPVVVLSPREPEDVSAVPTAHASARHRPRGGARGARRAPSWGLASTGAIVAFYVLAYAISWGWSFTLVANGDIVRRGVGWPTASPALAGPAIAAVIVTVWIAGRVGLADLARRIVRWRFALRWWAATLSPLAFLGIGLGVAALTGHLPKASDFGRYNGWPLISIGGAALAALLGGFAEETGWRGFALPAFERRVGAQRAALIVAAFWALWHLPYFFLVSSYRGFGPFTLVGFTIGIAAGSVVLTWLYYGAGQSILAVAVWHAAYDMATAGSSGTIAAIVSTVVIIQAIALVRLHQRALKHGSRPILGPSAETGPT